MKKSLFSPLASKKQTKQIKYSNLMIPSILFFLSLSAYSSFDNYGPAYNESVPAIDIKNDTRSNLLLLLSKEPVLMKDNISLTFDDTKIPCNLLQFNIFADFYNISTPRDCQYNDDYRTRYNHFNKITYYLELLDKDPASKTQVRLLMTPDPSFSQLPHDDQKRILKLQEAPSQGYYMYDKYMKVESTYNNRDHRISNNLDSIINFYHAVNNDHTFSAPFRLELKDIRDSLFNAFNQTEYQQILSDTYAVNHFIDQGNAPEFVIYLFATQYFYEGKFDLAQALFEKLKNAQNPWLKETATYMLIRTGLNQIGSYEDSWSDKPTSINREMKTYTQDAIKIYLSAFTNGLYAESAKSLQARLYWLIDESDTLTHYYENELVKLLNQDIKHINTQNEMPANTDQILSNLQKQSKLKTPPETVINTIQLINLVNEIDAKLLEEKRISLETGTILSYIQILKDLRPLDNPVTADETLKFNQNEVNLVIQKLNQLGLTDAALYLDLIVDWKLHHNPAIIARIPAVEVLNNKLFEPNVFALINLRSDILEAQEKYSELIHLWQTIIASENITQSQQQYAQLRLAHAYIINQQIEQIFAVGSPISSLYFKSAILSQTGDNNLLREQAKANNNLELRQIALYNLLNNNLFKQDYDNFAKDLHSVEALLTKDNSIIYPSNFPEYEKNSALENLSKFNGISKLEEGSGPIFQCPSIQTFANRLATNQYADATATLCLADFIRNNTDYWVDQVHPEYLSDGKKPATSLKLDFLYDTVLQNPDAEQDEKAYALFRKISCYYPNGYNTCSDVQVPESERKRWFKALKSTYKDTRWGKSLKYYW